MLSFIRFPKFTQDIPHLIASQFSSGAIKADYLDEDDNSPKNLFDYVGRLE